MIQKAEWRQILSEKRKGISPARRIEASLKAFETFKDRRNVLSFFSFSTEIDLSHLNSHLAFRKQLFLPRVEEGLISLYRVETLDSLVISHFGIPEPNPQICEKVGFQEIGVALIPGLGFDPDHYRIGYGKGHYDRLLPHLINCTIGIGFREQKVDGPLPRDPWDRPVVELLLF